MAVRLSLPGGSSRKPISTASGVNAPAKAAHPGAPEVAELAQSRCMRECVQWFMREKQWINEQHVQLCRIPAPTFLEQKRAEWVAAQFRALGYATRIDQAGNVLAQSARDREGPLVALTAHLDTVLAPHGPDDIRVGPDGRFHGPGVSDNGAGLAALLSIAAAWKVCQPLDEVECSLLFVANVGEEGEGNLNGMRYLCRQSSIGSRIAAFIILDGPATDHITWQALASRRFEISFSGPGGHSWSDFGIANPVHALARSIAQFAENRGNIRAAAGPRYSFNFGMIDGGSSVNSIPTSASAKLDIRSESIEKIDELTSLLSVAVEKSLEAENDRSTGGRINAKIREIGSRPGGQLTEDAAILSIIRAVDAHLSIRSRLDCASTDANIPLSMGLPAVSIGAGGQGGGAHTPMEWYHPEGREQGLKRILLALCLLMRSPETGKALTGKSLE